jgi:predicted amidohydrolase YtcJ
MTVRVFCMVAEGMGNTPEQVTQNLPKIAAIKLFQGDEWLDDIVYGEQVYGPASDNMLHPKAIARPEDFEQWGRIAREIAKAGLALHVHTTLEGTADGFLEQIEKINREFPIRALRWTTYHSDQLTKAHIERMKTLGMYVGVHMRPPTIGGIFLKIRGDRGYDNPPIQWVQNSGIMWGIGTDFNLGPYNPFISLRYLVTGKMVGGIVVNRQPISREDALIAHTRRNAFFVFQENNLGSIQTGKLADLVVLDRDYLTIPADQIKDIKPVLTMVGGKIVYEAAVTATR